MYFDPYLYMCILICILLYLEYFVGFWLSVNNWKLESYERLLTISYNLVLTWFQDSIITHRLPFLSGGKLELGYLMEREWKGFGPIFVPFQQSPRRWRRVIVLTYSQMLCTTSNAGKCVSSVGKICFIISVTLFVLINYYNYLM